MHRLVIIAAVLTGAATAQTSYTNPGGSGDRRHYVRVGQTLSGGATVLESTGIWDIGSTVAIIDGTSADSEARFWGGAVSGVFLGFDFGYRHIVDAITWEQSTANAQGTWKMQASSDAAAWTDIGAPFALGGATSAEYVFNAGGATAYRYWRLMGVSGNSSLGTWVRQIKFRIATADGPPPDTVFTYGNRTASITVEKSSDLLIASGALSSLVDGSNTGGVTFTVDQPISGRWLRFDFGADGRRIVTGAVWRWNASGVWGTGGSTWKWQRSDDATNWTDIGDAYVFPGDGLWSNFVSSGLWEALMYRGLVENVTPARYLRIYGVSGALVGVTVQEIEFRQSPEGIPLTRDYLGALIPGTMTVM